MFEFGVSQPQAPCLKCASERRRPGLPSVPPGRTPSTPHTRQPPTRFAGGCPGAGIRQALALATCGSLGPGQAWPGPDIGPISHQPGRLVSNLYLQCSRDTHLPNIANNACRRVVQVTTYLQLVKCPGQWESLRQLDTIETF